MKSCSAQDVRNRILDLWRRHNEVVAVEKLLASASALQFSRTLFPEEQVERSIYHNQNVWPRWDGICLVMLIALFVNTLNGLFMEIWQYLMSYGSNHYNMQYNSIHIPITTIIYRGL